MGYNSGYYERKDYEGRAVDTFADLPASGIAFGEVWIVIADEAEYMYTDNAGGMGIPGWEKVSGSPSGVSGDLILSATPAPAAPTVVATLTTAVLLINYGYKVVANLTAGVTHTDASPESILVVNETVLDAVNNFNTITWTAPSSLVTSYEVYRTTGDESGVLCPRLIASGLNALTLVDDGIAGVAHTPTTVNNTGSVILNGDVVASTFTSTVAGGTAPLTVTSPTLVTNLNADTVDGSHASTFVKRTPMPDTVASAADVTPNADTTDLYTVTALAVALTFHPPSGTPTNGQKLIIRILDAGVAKVLAWDLAPVNPKGYRAGTVALPLITTAGKTMYCGFIYNSAGAGSWDLLGYADNF